MATINPLMRPIDYTVDVQSPFESALGGLKIGAGVAEIQASQQKRELERKALEQAQKAQTDLTALFANPNATSADYFRVSAFLPKDQAAIVTQGFEAQTKEQQQNTLRQGTQVYTAIKSGNLPVAEMQLKEQAVALRNSGREKEAQGYDDLSNLIRLNPTGAQTTIALTIAGLPGGKDFLESADKTLSTQRAESLQPSALKEAVAKAEKAVSDATVAKETATNAPAMQKAEADLKTAEAEKAKIDAEFARAKTVLEVQQQAATLRKTNEDIIINKENARIAALNAAQARETNVIRREELQQKIDDAKEKRDQADRDQKATLAIQSADIDNFINTATRIKQTPRDIINSATGPIASRLPTTNQDVADFEALVETLGSQAFLAQIPKIKGTGNLTEKEGDKLQASLQNLSLKQSPDRLIANVDEAVRLLEKARVSITARSGLPATPSDVPARELNVTVAGTTYNFPTKAAADAFKNSDAYRRAAGTR
jgi:hypothetical protein